jgi:hypothetical protein
MALGSELILAGTYKGSTFKLDPPLPAMNELEHDSNDSFDVSFHSNYGNQALDAYLGQVHAMTQFTNDFGASTVTEVGRM